MKSLFTIVILFALSIHCRPLSVLFVTDKFPFEPRQFINNQITGFIDEGVDVTILAKNATFNYTHAEIDKYRILEKTYYNNLPAHLKSFDIIYIQLGNAFNMFDCIKNGEVKGKLVVCFIGGDATGKFYRDPYCYNRMFSKIDLALPVCDNFAANIIKYGCPKDRVVVHKSGIDCKRFTFVKRQLPKDGVVKIVTVGRLCGMKGHEYAIRAIALLKNVYPLIKYEIIGESENMNSDKEYADKLKNIIHELKVENYITLCGHLSHAEVLQKLERAHIFVLLSCTVTEGHQKGNQEGIPNVIMEAYAMGLPVVATTHSGIVDLVEDGKSGYLVPEYSIEAPAKKLFQLIQEHEKWEKMAMYGFKKVQLNHDKDKLNRMIINKFKKMVALE